MILLVIIIIACGLTCSPFLPHRNLHVLLGDVYKELYKLRSIPQPSRMAHCLAPLEVSVERVREASAVRPPLQPPPARAHAHQLSTVQVLVL